MYDAGWEEQADAIVQTWTLVHLPDDVDDAEAFDIIFGLIGIVFALATVAAPFLGVFFFLKFLLQGLGFGSGRKTQK